MATKSRWQSAEVDTGCLREPLTFPFSGRTAPNRFLKGAMSERLSSWDSVPEARGIPSAELIELYRKWGQGAIGVLVTGNIMIEVDHLEAAGNPIIPSGAPCYGPRFEAFRQMAAVGKASGSLIVAQVNHPGRQCDQRIQPNPISASDIQLAGTVMRMIFGKPHPASQEEIDRIVAGFAHAAGYLEEAGFDGVEIHAAHGYLISQFISPTTNKRSDKYGGNLEGRSRLLLEVVQAIRTRVSPSFIIAVKLNSVEFQDGGFQPQEARELCAELEKHHVDFIELSGGTYEVMAFTHRRESTRKREAFFLEFAESIAPTLRATKVYVTGGFKTAGAMVTALNSVDGVGLGRPLSHEPWLCREILDGNVKGSLKLLLDENNTTLTNTAAVLQMWKLARGQETLDMTQEDGVKNFLRELSVWPDRLQETEGNERRSDTINGRI